MSGRSCNPERARGDVFRRAPPRTLTGANLEHVAFPLGGLGTGSICLGGWGQLRDWEIMNRPNKGFCPEKTFFAIDIRRSGKKPIFRSLQGPVVGDCEKMESTNWGECYPHFRNAEFTGAYPFARVRLSDPEVPLQVEIEAFNPFIPLNAKDSGLPAAVLNFKLINLAKDLIEVTVFAVFMNYIGYPEKQGVRNNTRRYRGLTGLLMTNNGIDRDSACFGSMVLATTLKSARIFPYVNADRPDLFFLRHLDPERPQAMRNLKHPCSDAGMIQASVRIPPRGKFDAGFIIAWHFPNVVNYWAKQRGNPGKETRPWRNYYAKSWTDAWDVAGYVAGNYARLYRQTREFADAFFSSTLPAHVLDAVSSQLSTLRSPTCLRLEDGTFYGFEGCQCTAGCCEGNCTHVWNYAQALPYLFPGLQRSMRAASFFNCMRKDGFVQFRLPLPLGAPADFRFHPAADGQMGEVLQVYRDWLICGDDAWLRKIWPYARKALEFAWKYWDADRDGVMEGMQHNTYDIEFYGPNAMISGLNLCALKAAEKIAGYLGEGKRAERYGELFRQGSDWIDKHLFNGEYYEQKINPNAHKIWPARYRELSAAHGRDERLPWPRWQAGKGCLSDQLIGQWYAEMLGLGCIFKKNHVRTALRSIFKYNWKRDLSGYPAGRKYGIGKESGLMIATWPKGETPGCPFYFLGVWSGIEYQVAAHLIYEGFVREGLEICMRVRQRYAGARRNPWDEIECGHHYARAMSSYSLLLALSGFSYSAPEHTIGFAPRIYEDDFRVFFSVASGWGCYLQKFGKGSLRLCLQIKYGRLSLRKLIVKTNGKCAVRTVTAAISGRTVQCRLEGNLERVVLVLDSPIMLRAGENFNALIRL